MKKGFTLIELMIVIGILAILIIAVLVNMSGQRGKAEDTRAKSDLARLKIAFEDYYNDNNCYPPAAWFDSAEDCGGDNLAPYMNSIPCNPNTNLPYYLVYPTSQCASFRIYTTLNNQSDPDSLSNPVTIGSTTYHYGVSSTNLTFDDGSPATPHSYYWCSAINNCTSYDISVYTCTPSFTDDANCGGTSSSKCASAGSCVAK